MKPRHTSQAGPARIALRAAPMLVLLAGCTPTPPSANTSPSTPIQTTATSATAWTAPPGASPIDTTDWVVYESKEYGFSIKHPPGWDVLPAERDWTLEADAGPGDHRGEDAEERFEPPANDLFVAVWSAPANDTPETLAGVAAWVERYCKMESSSCSGLDRSVRLCNGTDCGPGLLVTVNRLWGATAGLSHVGAFFTGGKHKGRMIGVEVARPEGDPVVAKYGGARRLLEGFLSGMGVCPARPDQAPAGCP